MSVTLKNKTHRMKVIPLPHRTYCAALGECACVALPGMKNKVASSLTIPAGEAVPDIPDAVLAVDQVIRMLRTGELDVQRTPKRNDTITKDLKKKRSGRKRKRNES
jgi:hypothetical protein